MNIGNIILRVLEVTPKPEPIFHHQTTLTTPVSNPILRSGRLPLSNYI